VITIATAIYVKK